MADKPPTTRRLGDLRKPKPRTPQTSAPPAGIPKHLQQVLGGQRLPIQTGQPILTDFEKAGLRKLGWKEGDPLPENLSSMLTTEQAKALADDATPNVEQALRQMGGGVLPDQVSMPKEIPIKDLPIEKQLELTQALADAKVQQAAITAQRNSFVPGAGAGVNEAIQAALETPLKPPPDIIEDDLTQKPSVQPEITSDDGAGGAPAVKNCPHCGWDLIHPTPDVTDEDKLRWLVAQEGQQRFFKVYSLFAGRISVTFRSLTSREVDLSWRQLALDGISDLQKKEIHPSNDYWRNVMTYRLVMAIDRFWSSSSGPIEIAPVDEMTIDAESCPAPNTALYAMLPTVTEAVMSSDSLRRVIGAAHHEFQLLVENLEAHATDDSFWSAIAGQS